VVNCERTTT